jgi:hypothetical protein
MEKTITITYDVVKGAIALDCDTFTTFETLGLLEAAKVLVAEKWLKNEGFDTE